MDQMTLAAAVVTVIRPLLGQLATAAAGEELAALDYAVRVRLGKDTYHDTVLRGADDQPDNDCRVQSLISAVAEVAVGDPEFAETLAGLLAAAAPARYLRAVDSGAMARGDLIAGEPR